LGDGSDFTAFQDFAGISTLNVEYAGEDDGTQYHSIYDDFYWYTHFVDTNFVYGRALAQTIGTAAMRLADADLIPVDYSPQAEAISKYETELEKLLKEKQDEFPSGISSRKRECLRQLTTAKAKLAATGRACAAVHEFCCDEECDRTAQEKCGKVFESVVEVAGRRFAGIAGGKVGINQLGLAQSAQAIPKREGTARTPVVQKSNLRAGCLHWLWGQAHRGSPRIYGREKVEGSGRADTGRCSDNRKRISRH
jgi:hypothetical protein